MLNNKLKLNSKKRKKYVALPTNSNTSHVITNSPALNISILGSENRDTLPQLLTISPPHVSISSSEKRNTPSPLKQILNTLICQIEMLSRNQP